MAKYHAIVQHIRRLIEDQKLQPGDPLPPERELAKQFGVAYGTVRMANDLLIRHGIIDRQQGRGTFVATQGTDPAALVAPSQSSGKVRRLGLLSVEMGMYESPYLRALTFSLQRLVQAAGYELVVEQLEIEQLVQGKLPRMIRRHSVDGFFLYGRVRQHHIQFLMQQSLPFIQVGNRPIDPTVPQVRINAEHLGYSMTYLLLEAGKRPVWLDADPSNTDYAPGQEFLRGHTRAVAEVDPGAPLHLCSIRMHRIEQVVEQLLNVDLTGAAFIVQDWAASLVMMTLAMRDAKKLSQLLVVPLPSEDLCRQIQGPNVVKWTGMHSIDQLATPAAESLIRAVESKGEQPQSIQIEFDCKMVQLAPEPQMSCNVTPAPYIASKEEVEVDYSSADLI